MIIIALWLKLAPMYNRVQVLAPVVLLAAPAAARVVRAHLLIQIKISLAMKTITTKITIKRRRSNRQNS